MFKNLRQFYAIAICFIASLSIMIASALLLMEIINLSFSEQRCASLADFASNDRYIEKKKQGTPGPWEGQKNISYNPEMDKWSDEKITEKRLEERRYTLENYRDENIRALTNSLVWIFISGLFFAIHWRLYRKL